jgi:hypothetical protein
MKNHTDRKNIDLPASITKDGNRRTVAYCRGDRGTDHVDLNAVQCLHNALTLTSIGVLIVRSLS